MFDNLGGWELLALILVALFIIGPERLPKVISDALGALRKLRSMARNATSDLSRELGTTIELEDLHPKTFLRKHLLSEAEEEALRKPFQDVYREVRGVNDEVRGVADTLNLKKDPARPAGAVGAVDASGAVPAVGAAETVGADPPPRANGARPRNRYEDAT